MLGAWTAWILTLATRRPVLEAAGGYGAPVENWFATLNSTHGWCAWRLWRRLVDRARPCLRHNDTASRRRRRSRSCCGWCAGGGSGSFRNCRSSRNRSGGCFGSLGYQCRGRSSGLFRSNRLCRRRSFCLLDGLRHWRLDYNRAWRWRYNDGRACRHRRSCGSLCYDRARRWTRSDGRRGRGIGNNIGSLARLRNNFARLWLGRRSRRYGRSSNWGFGCRPYHCGCCARCGRSLFCRRFRFLLASEYGLHHVTWLGYVREVDLGSYCTLPAARGCSA